jgi:hypothetical protein
MELIESIEEMLQDIGPDNTVLEKVSKTYRSKNRQMGL